MLQLNEYFSYEIKEKKKMGLLVSSTSSVLKIHCIKSPPVSTLGIFDIKLFTDFIGRPLFSSCIRSTNDSI